MKKTISKKLKWLYIIIFIIFIPVFGYAADWTVMIYLDADNNLESDGIEDFIEIATTGSDASINYVVQMDRISGYESAYDDWTDCKRFYVEKDMTPIPQNAVESLGEINMGDPDRLSDFIQWSMTNYSAQRYALILWDHGDGWRKRTRSNLTRTICWDDTDVDGSGLSMIEFKNVLTSLPIKPDLVGFDACLMAMLENAYMLKLAGVSVMVGSEETEPVAGWPYDRIASGLALHPSWTAGELGSWIVDQYYLSYEMDETQSAIDLSKIDPVISALTNLSTNIQMNWQDNVDAIHNAAKDLRVSIDNSVINTKNGDSYSHAGGVSIYFPTTSYSYDSQYNEIDLSKQTSWDEFLSNFYELMTGSWISIVRRGVLSFYDEDFIDLRHLTTLLESFDPHDYSPLYMVEEVAYNFIDIQSTGTRIEIEDDSNVSINPANFTFEYYGNVYETFYISDNGVIFFSRSSSSGSSNHSIPDENSFNGTFIAPFWDDFGDAIVYWEVQNNALIIQWDSVFHYNYSSEKTVTFQAILYANGNISFQYKDTLFNSESIDYGNSATVGVQGSEIRGLQYSLNEPAIQGPFALHFIPENDSGCFYSLENYHYTISAQGESRSLSLKIKDECEWRVSTMDNWIHILSETSGVGPAQINFQISENPDFVERLGKLDVANRSITVVQETKCNFDISPLQHTIDASGGNGSITIDTNFSECVWNVENSFPWIHTSDISGTGSANLSYTIDSNPLYNERNGYIGINNTLINFIQQKNMSSIILENSEPVSEIFGENDQYQYFKIYVPENHTDLIINSSGGSGDCDLYVRYNDIPDKSNYDQKSANGNNDETLYITNPQFGDYYILLYAYDPFSGVTIQARYIRDNSSNCVELTATIEAQALSIANLKAELEKNDGYEIALSPGWHLLNGLNVYAEYPITSPANCIEAIFQYKDGSYQSVDSMIDPFQAIWVKVKEECNFILKKQRKKIIK